MESCSILPNSYIRDDYPHSPEDMERGLSLNNWVRKTKVPYFLYPRVDPKALYIEYPKNSEGSLEGSESDPRETQRERERSDRYIPLKEEKNPDERNVVE